MNQQTKRRISNISTWVMIITIGIISIWFLGFIISNTFDLNVFSEKTSDFFISLFGTALVLVFCSAFLNISINISIIADSKSYTIPGVKSQTGRYLLFGFLGVVLFVTGALFAGDYYSRKILKSNLYQECKDLIDRNNKILNDLSIDIKEKSKVFEIPKILGFLENQKKEFPTVTLILPVEYKDQLTFIKINSWSDSVNLAKDYYNLSVYPCEKFDCDYLTQIFTTSDTTYLLWTSKNNYRLYFPIKKNDTKFILLFDKTERYGRAGS